MAIVEVRRIAIAMFLAGIFVPALRGEDEIHPREGDSFDPAVVFQEIAPTEQPPAPTDEGLSPTAPPVLAPALTPSERSNGHWIAAKPDSAKFPKASQIPGTEIWWKFGGYVKADFIHDFKPAGTPERWVQRTIPVDGPCDQNTLLMVE